MPLIKLKLLEIFLKSEFPDTVLNLHILFVAPLIYAISYALLSIAIISERDVSPSITWSKREYTTDFTCCINNSFMILAFTINLYDKNQQKKRGAFPRFCSVRSTKT